MKVIQVVLLCGAVYLTSARYSDAAVDTAPQSQDIIGPVKPVDPVKPLLCLCGFENEPVCGSDGVTYLNICFFNCENDKRKKAGKELISVRCFNMCVKCLVIADPRPVLPDLCLCEAIHSPVCGSNGVTYSNQCEFNCENKRRERNGERPLRLRCQKACNDPKCFGVLEPVPFEPAQLDEDEYDEEE